MPPESLPWDRKDFFKERKHEKSESLGSSSRWRDSYHGSREFHRWGSAEFRRPAGYGKQGSWHQFSEESSHGYGPSRSSGDKMPEDESFRTSLPRGDSKYVRTGRESRGSFSHRDWRSHSRETNSGSASLPRRPPHDLSSDQRAVDDTGTYCSLQSVFVSMSDQTHSKDWNDKIGGVYGSENGPRSDVDDSLGSTEWKPLKWSRSGSLSSRGSALSSSSKSKNEKADLPLRIASPIESPSAEAVCATSSLPFEETTSRKKPRLGWGDGLAKYEKEKVEAPDVNLKKEVALLSSSSADLTHSLGSSLAEKSPKVLAFSDCTSPATPSSFACSSSSGLEDKTSGKEAIAHIKTSTLCSSPGPQPQEVLSNSEKLATSTTNMSISLVEAVHSDDPSSGVHGFERSTALNKLLAYKSEISKTLEVTESEIDSLETELKFLRSENGGHSPHPISCGSKHLGESGICSKEGGCVSNLIPRPAPLEIVSSSDATVEKMPVCNSSLVVEDVDLKNEEIDSPGTVTSKFNEPHCAVKAVPSNFVGNDHCPEVTDAILPDEMEKFPSSGAFVDEQKTVGCGNECGLDKTESYSSLCDLIFSCNKECANRAAEIFYKQLPTDQCNASTSGIKIVSCSQGEKLIKQKFAMRKQLLKFKETVLTLKFKALKHLWKEDLHLRAVKKSRSRHSKKLELSSRVTQSGYQKYRSSFRSRFVQPGAYQNPVPTTNVINYSSKLLLNPGVRLYRNTLKMPAMILDENEKIASRFISYNGLVEDPYATEKERNMINPWTSAEKEIFWEKLALFGKDFSKVSSFLDLKSTADCVEFYYKNHKSDSFKKSRNLELGKQVKFSATNYLVTSGKKRNQELNAASLDMLSAVTVMAANADKNIGDLEKCSSHLSLGENMDSKLSWGADGISANENNCDFFQTERETVAADVLAGIGGSLSSEAMSSCITSSVDPGEGHREKRCYKVDSDMKVPSTPDAMQRTGSETSSEDSAGDVDSSNWTDEEKSIFIQAVASCGKDFDMISRCVRSKSRDQCKVFFSKARKCLGLDLMHLSGHIEAPGSGDDASGDGTDTEDPSVVETCTARSYDESGSRPADDLSTSANRNHGESLGVKGAENLGNLASDLCKEGDRPEIVSSDPVCNLTNSVTSKMEDVSDNIEAGSNLSDEPDILRMRSVSFADENSIAVSESRATDKLAFGEEKGSNSCSGDQITKCLVQDSRGIDFNLALDGGSSGLNLQISHPEVPEVDSIEKSCITSEGNSVAVKNSASQDSVVITNEQTAGLDRLSSTLGFQDVRDACRNPSLLHVESSETPCNYSFSKQTAENMNRNPNHAYLSQVQAQSKPDINCETKYRAEDCYLRKCNSSTTHLNGSSFFTQNAESDDHKNRSSDSDMPRKNGNVKLFGQILSPTPSLPNSNSCSNEKKDEKGPYKSTGNSFDLEVNPGIKLDRNSYPGLENVPMRSYGFWDGSRIQTGFSALPDSAILQAKYPAAFSGYSATSPKIDQQPLQLLSTCSDRSFNRVADFPMKDGAADFQSYRSRDGAKMQPLAVDLFSEMSRRTGYEGLPMSGLQQQGRVFVGMNVVGRGGILMGGSCTGVSDPVAAIKMHYAKAEQYMGQSGSMFSRREDGCWGSNGDLGSR